MILLNLVFTFTIPGISIGAHIGGLIGGAGVGFLIVELDKRRVRRRGPARVRRDLARRRSPRCCSSRSLIARSKYPSVG